MKPSDKAKFLYGISIVFASLAANEHIHPTTNRPNGRYSWITGPVFDKFGHAGLIIYWLGIAALLALIATSNFRRDK